jgi:hypothetical protein
LFYGRLPVDKLRKSVTDPIARATPSLRRLDSSRKPGHRSRRPLRTHDTDALGTQEVAHSRGCAPRVQAPGLSVRDSRYAPECPGNSGAYGPQA